MIGCTHYVYDSHSYYFTFCGFVGTAMSLEWIPSIIQTLSGQLINHRDFLRSGWFWTHVNRAWTVMDNGVCQRNFCPEKLGPGPWTWNFSPVGYAMQDTLTIFLSYTVGSTSSHLPIHYINHLPIIYCGGWVCHARYINHIPIIYCGEHQ